MISGMYGRKEATTTTGGKSQIPCRISGKAG
jgi:hypothetical protein